MVGINYVKDVINEHGKMLSLTQIKTKYNKYNLQQFYYYRLHRAVLKCVNRYKSNNDFDLHNPSMPLYLQMLYKERTGTQYFSSILDNKTIEMKFTKKWKSILIIEINQNTWKNIFMIAIKKIQDNQFKWL